MRLRSMTFREHEDETLGPVPASVTVTLTEDEVLYLAVLTGKHSEVTADEVMPGGAEANHSVYDGLVGGVFNRYYDGGVDEALRKR